MNLLSFNKLTCVCLIFLCRLT
ncbi:hypothetical protein F383_11711 [Gossypium arboreum]|uniref:Uncharacterized protein n=1 Tax=Gossypium arboreum TaxID=29729 RepID=A0A0B0NJR2_GOSAR|nr:hypothetical protein F383_19472 [Gossypium arboreum]KHG30432.1 hypothetical protein F383_11711 [Gossypium arboreum]